MRYQITISRDGQQYGPYSTEDLSTHLQSGAILADDLAWTLGMAEWRPLREIVEIAGPPGERPRTPAPPIIMQSGPDFPEVNDYSKISLLRKGSLLDGMGCVAVVLWIVGLAPIGFMILIFPSIMVLTGQVYTKKKLANGSIKTWEWGHKAFILVMTALMLLISVAMIALSS